MRILGQNRKILDALGRKTENALQLFIILLINNIAIIK